MPIITMQESFVRTLLADPKRQRKEDMNRPGLASPDLRDSLPMTFAVDIAFRTQRTSQLVYHFPGPNAWMA